MNRLRKISVEICGLCKESYYGILYIIMRKNAYLYMFLRRKFIE